MLGFFVYGGTKGKFLLGLLDINHQPQILILLL